MKSRRILLAALLFSITLTSFSTSAADALDFTLEAATGNSITLSNYKGKVVLLDFWATWCGGCKIEIPWFMEFAEKYKGEGLVVLGVSMDGDGWQSVKPFIKENKLNYPIVLGSDSVAERYGVDAMPMTLLINRHGRIASSHIGLTDKSVFEDEIRTLLLGK